MDEHQRGRTDTHRAQFRLRQPSGHDVWVFATLVARSVSGKPATLGTALDVRERRHAQESVAKAQRLDAVARLAGGIAHDFNNALQVILGHAERVVGALPESHPVHESAVEIRRAAMRAAHLTDRLLSFGQRQLLDPQPLDLPRLIVELKSPIERRVGPSVSVVLRRGKWTAPVRVDRTRFVHVLAALVDNAREAMPQGGQLVVATDIVTIDAAARAERPWLRHGRLRSPDGGGFRSRARRRSDDARLRAVLHHQGQPGRPGAAGRLRAGEAEPRLRVDRERADRRHSCRRAAAGRRAGDRERRGDASRRPARRAAAGSAAARAGGRRRRLCPGIDGRARSSGNGFSVTAVGSAEEAVGFAPGTYDVLLTDISLPGMNGVDLAKRILGAAPAAKVLLMSGYAREEYLTPADDLPFIGKPFTTRAIVDRLRSILAEPPVASPESRPA